LMFSCCFLLDFTFIGTVFFWVDMLINYCWLISAWVILSSVYRWLSQSMSWEILFTNEYV
jgi:hypothetical protein